MLEIKNLHVSVGDGEILKGLDLKVKGGEVHAIMGLNGSGKTTLANVLAGREEYKVNSGEVLFREKDLFALSPEDRAREGLFLAFQYPVELSGVNQTYFLRTALNNIRKYRGEKVLNVREFSSYLKEKSSSLGLENKMFSRSVNEGFSGGEKKRNEVLQMSLLSPRLCILDETDSGLDVDALQVVSNGVNSMRDKDRSFIVITHYQRLLDYIEPDFVHIMIDGRIVKSGDKDLALQVEENGYLWLTEKGAEGKGLN